MENRGTIVWWVIILAVIAAIVYFNFFDGDSKESTPSDTTTEEISEGELLANSLADKYGATVVGGESLSFTIQAQDLLLSGKPVVFDAYLDDVYRRDGKTYVRFQSYDETDYVLELECDPQMIEDKVLSQTDASDDWLFWLYNEYVVVANITEVSKPVIALNAVAGYDEGDAEIEVETSSVFSAKGTCVDMEHVVIGD